MNLNIKKNKKQKPKVRFLVCKVFVKKTYGLVVASYLLGLVLQPRFDFLCFRRCHFYFLLIPM